MAFTDPPYNVDYGDHGGAKRKGRKRKIANDALSPEQWDTFVRGWARILIQKEVRDWAAERAVRDVVFLFFVHQEANERILQDWRAMPPRSRRLGFWLGQGTALRE